MRPDSNKPYWGKPDQGKAQDTAPYSSPTGTGRGEESGAVCICANAAFVVQCVHVNSTKGGDDHG